MQLAVYREDYFDLKEELIMTYFISYVMSLRMVELSMLGDSDDRVEK